MTFDFKKAMVSAAEQQKETNKLSMLVLGQSGSGKSTALGTTGLKTLLLYTRGESHSPAASKVFGKDNIVPVCIDFDGSAALNASQALKRLTDILDSVDDIKAAGFKVIAIDSASEVEAMIRGSNTFTNLVGGNKFKEIDVMIDIMRSVMLKLFDLQQKLGVHVIVTCPLDVKEISSLGEIVDSAPKLLGFRNAEALVQLFADIVVVGAMTNGETVSHRFQFMAGVSKEQKDASGSIKKTVNFRPRLTGVNLLEALPDHGTLPANLADIIKMKAGIK